MAPDAVSTPLFSVITPSFNRASLIGEAIASVHAQEMPGVEHIVIDGGSKDGTLEVLAQFPHLRVVSEPDRGIYDALNKGFAMARGEIIALLNTDDCFVPGKFRQIAAAFEDPTVQAVHAGSDIYEETPQGERVIRRFITAEEIDLSWENVTVGVGTINARFWRRSFFERLAPFDLRYRIASDRDLLIRAARLRPQAVLLEDIVYRYRLHGDSLTLHHGEPRYREEHLTMAKHYLKLPGLSAEVRGWMRRLHTKETLESAVSAGTQGNWSRALAMAYRGCLTDPAWPLRFGQEAVAAVKRRLLPASTSTSA